MTRIKICGITREKDAELCAELGVDALGLVFHPGSPRCVSPERARALRERIPQNISLVGVFVDEKPDIIRAIFADCGLDRVQLHGKEDEEYCESMGLPYIKALPVGLGEGVPVLAEVFPGAEALLLDTAEAGKFGGTGTSFDLSGFPTNTNRRIFVAGGLGADNVRGAIEATSPWGVDASSRLETSPGVKDRDLVTEFVRAARMADVVQRTAG